MAIHFLTFGGGKSGWRSAAKRLAEQAKDIGVFEEIHFWTDLTLKEIYPEPYNEHLKLMKESPRGFGYWWWKPFLAVKTLQQMEDGDTLCYLDAGCELNKYGITKLKQYIQKTQEKGALFFQIPQKEKLWTKMDTLMLFNAETNEDILNSGQVESNAWLICKSKRTIALLNDWNRIHHLQDHHFATDAPSHAKNLKCFNEHRHDQSILSLLVKKHKYPISQDRRYWPSKSQKGIKSGYHHQNAKQQPFLIMRNSSSKSKMPNYKHLV